MGKEEIMLIIKKFYYLLFFLLLEMLLYTVPLSTVEGLDRLSNYNEIKSIEVERIYEKEASKSVLEKKNSITYIKGENKPFTGILIGKKNQKDIIGMYSYKNGQHQGIQYDYYENGQLSVKLNAANDKNEGEGIVYYENGKISEKRFYKNGIIIDSTGYYENGNLFSTLKSTGGLNAIITEYYENGVKKSVLNVIQDYSVLGTIKFIKKGFLAVMKGERNEKINNGNFIRNFFCFKCNKIIRNKWFKKIKYV